MDTQKAAHQAGQAKGQAEVTNILDNLQSPRAVRTNYLGSLDEPAPSGVGFKRVPDKRTQIHM